MNPQHFTLSRTFVSREIFVTAFVIVLNSHCDWYMNVNRLSVIYSHVVHFQSIYVDDVVVKPCGPDLNRLSLEKMDFLKYLSPKFPRVVLPLKVPKNSALAAATSSIFRSWSRLGNKHTPINTALPPANVSPLLKFPINVPLMFPPRTISSVQLFHSRAHAATWADCELWALIRFVAREGKKRGPPFERDPPNFMATNWDSAKPLKRFLGEINVRGKKSNGFVPAVIQCLIITWQRAIRGHRIGGMKPHESGEKRTNYGRETWKLLSGIVLQLNGRNTVTTNKYTSTSSKKLMRRRQKQLESRKARIEDIVNPNLRETWMYSSKLNSFEFR